MSLVIRIIISQSLYANYARWTLPLDDAEYRRPIYRSHRLSLQDANRLSYSRFLVPCTADFSSTSIFYFSNRLRSLPIIFVVNARSSNYTPSIGRNISVPFDCRLQIMIYNFNISDCESKYSRDMYDKYSLLLFRLTSFLMHLVISDEKFKYTIFSDYGLMRNNY